MFAETIRLTGYGIIFLGLLLIDHALGNGFVNMFQRMFCKCLCFIKRTIREEAKQVALLEDQAPVKLHVMLIEIMLLTLTIAFLKKYQHIRRKHDRIDDLLQESKEALRQTNEFLEKWRTRRVTTEASYLDDEPIEITPLKLEVPILHMAIIDTRGTARNQPERGDAGDSVNYTDSTLLSVTSLMDDDLESTLTESKSDEQILEDKFNVETLNRELWDVVEEDSNVDD